MNTDTDTDDLDIDVLAEDDSRPWAVGDEVTVLVAGISVPWGIPGFGNTVCSRGDVLQVTSDTLRHRQDFLQLVADPEQQIEKWGEIRIVRGRHEIASWTEIGSGDWHRARNRERDRANMILDPAERAEAIRAINTKYGTQPTSTSTEMRNFSERRRLAEDAARRAQQRHSIKSFAE